MQVLANCLEGGCIIIKDAVFYTFRQKSRLFSTEKEGGRDDDATWCFCMCVCLLKFCLNIIFRPAIWEWALETAILWSQFTWNVSGQEWVIRNILFYCFRSLYWYGIQTYITFASSHAPFCFCIVSMNEIVWMATTWRWRTGRDEGWKKSKGFGIGLFCVSLTLTLLALNCTVVYLVFTLGGAVWLEFGIGVDKMMVMMKMTDVTIVMWLKPSIH